MVANLLEQLGNDAAVESIAVGFNDGALIRRLAVRGIETHLLAEGNQGFTRLAFDCAQLLHGRRIDLVHAHRYKENLLATVVARMLGVRRKVTTVHGVPEVDAQAPLRSRLVTAIDRLNVRASFDAVVAVSAEMQRILLEWFGVRPERVRLIYNGIEMPQDWETAERDGKADVHIGTVGRMVPVKGYRLFLELAAHLHCRYRNVRFSILGDGPLMAQLTAEAARLGVSDYVAFLPPQPDPQPYYRGLDIYVNTSLHEGLPLSILEAMACATPVVAPRVGGIPEIVSDGAEGLLVESSDPQDFTRSCLSVLTNSWLRSAMGERARRTVAAHFRDTQMAEAYGDLYLELFERSAATPAGQVRRRVVTAAQRS